MSTDESIKRRPNRKRKKSFLMNARKYGKKGCFGRGSRLNEETYQYFVRIMEVYREGFENDTDKCSFVNNAFEHTVNEEILCSCNQVGCRVVETLLPFSNDAVVLRFLEAFDGELRPLCTDNYASHVIEALVQESYKRMFVKTESSDQFRQFTIKIGKFLLNNMEDFVWDTYANHIIRRVLRIYAQIPDDKNRNTSVSKETNELPCEYGEIIKDYGDRLLTWPQFIELPYSEITSGLLQVLVKAFSKVDLKMLKRYVRKLNKECFAMQLQSTGGNNVEDSCNKVFTSKSAIMLLESVLEVATPKLLSKVYAACFSSKLVSLAKSRDSNFAVQKLLSHCTNKVEFEGMFDEMSGHLGEVLEAGHTGVIFTLAQTCKRLAAKQGSFMKELLKIFHCSEPEERQNKFALCLCKLSTFEELEELAVQNWEKEKLNLHGTLILQTLLEFHKPIKIVHSILSMEATSVKELFCNTMGSHVMDSYVKGQLVGEKSRDKLARKLKGCYQDLACSKYGSRSFEAIWNVCSLKNKLSIMEELSYGDGAWSNTEFGKIIAYKVNLQLYKRNKEMWKTSLNTTSRAQKLAEMLT